MKSLNFEEDELWKYDSHNIVYNLRTSIMFNPYSHTPNVVEEKLANKYSCEEFIQEMTSQRLIEQDINET